MLANVVDVRLGNTPRYYLTRPKDLDMRVPDTVKKCVAFISVRRDGKIKYGGTAFLITVPGESPSVSFPFLVTARHVAEHIEHEDFFVRINSIDGSSEIVEGGESRWFYHPSGENRRCSGNAVHVVRGTPRY